MYGYRKFHDGQLDQGEMCCPNHVACPARLEGIKAQIGYKRWPGNYGCVETKAEEQGSLLTSTDWASFLRHHYLEHSMSRRGNCHDNAVAESV